MRLGILGSTRGTNLDAIIAAINASILPAEIVIVLSNKQDAGILDKARLYHLQHQFVSPVDLSREAFDKNISTILKKNQVDLIVLIGYMRILSEPFVNEWHNKIINIHPSLLPLHKGLMDLAVHQAVLDAGEKQTGCSVHYVTKEVDEGPVIAKTYCDVLPEDTAKSLKERVQHLENKTLIQALIKIQRGDYVEKSS